MVLICMFFQYCISFLQQNTEYKWKPSKHSLLLMLVNEQWQEKTRWDWIHTPGFRFPNKKESSWENSIYCKDLRVSSNILLAIFEERICILMKMWNKDLWMQHLLLMLTVFQNVLSQQAFVCFSFVIRALYPLKIYLGNPVGQDFSESNWWWKLMKEEQYCVDMSYSL